MFKSALKVNKMASETKRFVSNKVLTIDNMNPSMVRLQYAVRGPVALRSIEIERELANGVKKPFTSVTKAHVGEPQAMGQKPLTYFRQVLTTIAYPDLLESSNFPSDVKERAREILSYCTSLGTYTHPLGIPEIRQEIAQFIETRDQVPCDWENVILTSGASTGIRNVLKLFINDIDGKPTGILIPLPQYPLYSSCLTEYGIEQVRYSLCEERNWALDMEELELAIDDARDKCAVRAMVVINPGNPTGQVLPRSNIEEIVKFAYKHRLFILADEVYQQNVYVTDTQFISFKKVLYELGPPYNTVELASFMSCSKGYMGECGLRGGYMELYNIDPRVHELMYKTQFNGCPNIPGQIIMGLMARPPKEGDPSFELFQQEKSAILESLGFRAQLVVDTFKQMEGFHCSDVQGAMYAFPRIELPEAAVMKAKELGLHPDVYYAFTLLEETGICVVPGSGFGQREGTYHFRTTILPQPDKLKLMLDTFKAFHRRFTEQHS